MTDTDIPPFGDVFSDDLFDEDDGTTTTQVALDPSDVFDDTHDGIGSRISDGDLQPRFVGDSSELPAEV